MKQHHNLSKGYTLVETLVASAIIMLAVGAASSLSLSMVTQEEMSERMVIAANYLDNASRLYQLGIDAADIEGLLPVEPVVESFTPSTGNATVSGLGTMPYAEMTMVFKPGGGTATATDNLKWTGGNSDITRSHTIRVLRNEF